MIGIVPDEVAVVRLNDPLDDVTATQRLRAVGAAWIDAHYGDHFSWTWRPPLRASDEIPAPIGEPCLLCSEPIQAEDCGVFMIHMAIDGDAYRAWHLGCFRSALGVEGEGTKA